MGVDLRYILFKPPPNGVIVIRCLSACFTALRTSRCWHKFFSVKKPEWHFFHCLTQYGEVARFAREKSAKDDIHLVFSIQTFALSINP